MKRRGRGTAQQDVVVEEETGAPIYLISIRPRFAFQIFKGVKKFELRKWIGVPVPEGAVMVVYVSGHVKAIMGEFRVGRVYSGTAEQVWRDIHMHPSPGVGRDDWPYIRGARRALAFEVVEARLYPRSVQLWEIRRIIPGWMPPLSYKVLRPCDPIYELIIKPLRRLNA